MSITNPVAAIAAVLWAVAAIGYGTGRLKPMPQWMQSLSAGLTALLLLHYSQT